MHPIKNPDTHSKIIFVSLGIQSRSNQIDRIKEFAMDGLTVFLMYTGVCIGIFFILRTFWLWYWKIDERTQLLKQIKTSLDELNQSINNLPLQESKGVKPKNKSKEEKNKPDPNRCTGCNKKLSSPDKMEGKCHSCGTELKGDQLRLD